MLSLSHSISARGFLGLILAASAIGAGSALGQTTTTTTATAPDVVVDGKQFASWSDYAKSGLFRALGGRCGTPDGRDLIGFFADIGDCTASETNTDASYDPFNNWLYRIPVVVHVIRDDMGTMGHLSQAQVESQIDILNEDFRAIGGTNGEDGVDVRIEFYLATRDPNGQPTSGVTYTNNSVWFNDSGAYWQTLAWDPARYLNIYTNLPDGGYVLGYVPTFPEFFAPGVAGSTEERIVIHYQSFGRNAPMAPYDQGRTTTHEVGHYLGLYHTFQDGCSSPQCHLTGDLICDTNSESEPHFDCVTSMTCSSLDPIHNYMNYTNDLCMTEFTVEQVRRMRCTLENYRPDLFSRSPMPWHLDRIDQHDLPLDSKAEYAGRGEGVDLYVLATGVRTTHVELSGRAETMFDSVGDGLGGDPHGFGTYVAGVAAGQFGVAPEAQIKDVRVLNAFGAGSTSAVVLGLEYVYQNASTDNDSVVVLPLGGGPSVALDNAVETVCNAGIPVVVGASMGFGNSCTGSPSRSPHAITVGATNHQDDVAHFNDQGACVDLFAPGVDITGIWSTSDFSRKTQSGTGCSAAVTAGAVAVRMSLNPSLTCGSAKADLINNATVGVLDDVDPGTPNLLLYLP